MSKTKFRRRIHRSQDDIDYALDNGFVEYANLSNINSKDIILGNLVVTELGYARLAYNKL